MQNQPTPTTATPTAGRRAVGIVRVSQVGGREGDSFASPDEQRDRIRAACERDNLRLLDTIDELDVSGGTPLDKRAGLRRAVEMVEGGEADVIVAAYFDRLVRSLRVQDELVSRVERAGGRVLAVDIGQVTNGSAGQWLSGTMLGAVAEYQRRTTAERTREAQVRAVARGVAPYPVPPGYIRGEAGVFEPDPETAPVVAEAFAMRAGGASIADVRAHLAAGGVERSWHGTSDMLTSRHVLGEIHYGELLNLKAHPPIVDTATWKRAQRARAPRGRKPAINRLLGGLKVLKCGTCGSNMTGGFAHNGEYSMYRCPRSECERRVTISTRLADKAVTDAVRAALADVEGRASAESNVAGAVAELERAQSDLDAALRVLADFSDEAGARDRLEELRAERDAAQDRLDQLGGARAAETVNVGGDWDGATFAERRAFIRATVARAVVAPGRGPNRVTVELLGE